MEERPPLPARFVVSETVAERPAEEIDGHPYREAPPAAPISRLVIRWPTATRPARWLVLGWNAIWWTLVFTLSIADPLTRIAMVAGGVMGLWMLLVSWLNTTEVVADADRLVCRAGPVPMGRRFSLAAGEVAQLSVREQSRRRSVDYLLIARDRSGREHTVVALPAAEQAWWLEERIEQHLGVRDRLIDGEHRRPSLPAPGSPGDADDD